MRRKKFLVRLIHGCGIVAAKTASRNHQSSYQHRSAGYPGFRPLGRLQSTWSTARMQQYQRDLRAYSEYNKQLLKLFTFQVHPDFFHNELSVKGVNEANLKHLQSIMQDDLAEKSSRITNASEWGGIDRGQHRTPPSSSGSSARHLVFYIKPPFVIDESETDTVPYSNEDIRRTGEIEGKNENYKPSYRKVKVSVKNIAESMWGILDAIGGVNLPTAPELSSLDFHEIRESSSGRSSNDSSFREGNDSGRLHRYNQQNGGRYVSASRVAVLDYLDSLVDQRDLFLLRKDRKDYLRYLEKRLVSLTGARGIEYRHSWSAQHNIVMLQALTALIVESMALRKMKCPWTDMTIAFSKDDSSKEDENFVYAALEYSLNTLLGEEQFSRISLGMKYTAQQREYEKKQALARQTSSGRGRGRNQQKDPEPNPRGFIMSGSFSVGGCVDYVEGEVRLNPARVPAQWLTQLQEINQRSEISSRMRWKEKLSNMVTEKEEQLNNAMKRFISGLVAQYHMRSTRTNNIKRERPGEAGKWSDEAVRGIALVHEEDPEMLKLLQVLRQRAVVFKLNKGFTCSTKAFEYFVTTATFFGNTRTFRSSRVHYSEVLDRENKDGGPLSSSLRQEDADTSSCEGAVCAESCASDSDSTGITHYVVESTEKSDQTRNGDGYRSRRGLNVNSERCIELPPVCIRIVVEEAHGTRLLPDGSFRVDAYYFQRRVHAQHLQVREDLSHAANASSGRTSSETDVDRDGVTESSMSTTRRKIGYQNAQMKTDEEQQQHGSGRISAALEEELEENGGFAAGEEVLLKDLVCPQLAQAVSRCAAHEESRRLLSELKAELKERLSLESISTFPGVDDDKAFSCLSKLQSYLRDRGGGNNDYEKNNLKERSNFPNEKNRGESSEYKPKRYGKGGRKNLGVLRNLSGLHVVIGHYLGVSDDGGCIIPWDIQL